MVHQTAFPIQQRFQPLRPVAQYPRVKNQFRAAAADVHRIELHAACLTHESQYASRAMETGRSHQPVMPQQEAARLREAQSQHPETLPLSPLYFTPPS